MWAKRFLKISSEEPGANESTVRQALFNITLSETVENAIIDAVRSLRRNIEGKVRGCRAFSKAFLTAAVINDINLNHTISL